MANFRTTADLLDGVLRRSGEITSDVGTSPRQAAALLYLNQIHQTIISGGNELNVDVDESWSWAKARYPLVLSLNPAVTNVTVTLTQGSNSGTFSAAPQVNGSNASVEGWHVRLNAGPEVYRITQHTSGLTSFQLDAAFPQSSVSGGACTLFQVDYDLVGTYLQVTANNDALDFIELGTTVLTASLTHGSYTPSGLATHVASVLNSTGTHGNTYSCAYDSVRRFFTVSSALNGSGSPIFSLQGAGSNYYRSGWSTLGFDFTNQSGASSYVSLYPFSSVVRLTEPGRIFYGNNLSFNQNYSGFLSNIEAVTMSKNWPISGIQAGAPDAFCVLHESRNASVTIRLNKYPVLPMRVEFEHIPWPKDLQNSTASIPLIPQKYIRCLEYGASAYLLTDKSDQKAVQYFQIAQATLMSMMKSNRKEIEKTGKNYSCVIARPDMAPMQRRGRLNVYGYDQGNF